MRSRFKTRTIVLWAAIMTGLVFLTAILTSEMSYLTNDDSGIQSALSGFLTGEPYPYHQFINIIISFPIAGLYQVLPNIQWWYVYSLTDMAIGIFLVQFFIIRIASKGKHSLFVIFGILAFLDIGFFIYPIANVSFTIVPAILGTGIVAGLLWLSESDNNNHRRLIFFCIVVGYILLFAHRRQTGLALLCYILLAFLYYYVSTSKNLKETIIKFVVTAGVFILITGSLTALDSTVQNNHNGGDFVAFNSARIQFMDYPHDTYSEDPELFKEIGWDEDTYNLATEWCFLNEDVTTDNLAYISSNSVYTTASENILFLLEQIYHDKQCMAIILLYLASVIIGIFLVIVHFNKKTLLFLILNNVGTGLLLLYQILTGRAMYRSIMVVLLPAFLINVILSLQQEVDGKMGKPLYAGFIILGMICLNPILMADFDEEWNASIVSTKEKYNIIENYLDEHQNDFYIRETKGITENIDPSFLKNTTSNCMGWGSSSWYSAIYYAQLKNNGIAELNESTFKQCNVHFISKTNALSESYYDDGADEFAMFYRKLQENCGALGFVQEDTITGGAYVYHFVFDENISDYDSFYNIVEGHTVKEE